MSFVFAASRFGSAPVLEFASYMLLGCMHLRRNSTSHHCELGSREGLDTVFLSSILITTLLITQLATLITQQTTPPALQHTATGTLNTTWPPLRQ